jgi:hypothetical protein
VEASLIRVFQSGLKTGGGTTAGGARGTITEVASEANEDGRVDAMSYVESCYPTFAVFNVLDPRSIVILGLYIGPYSGWSYLPLSNFISVILD